MCFGTDAFDTNTFQRAILGLVGAILIGGAILIICVSNFRNRRD